MSSGMVDAFRLFYHRKFHTVEQIRRYQEKQLRRLIDLSMNESSFYRERFSTHIPRTLEELSFVSPINKEIMMANFDRLNTIGVKLEDVKAFAVQKELAKDYLGYYQDRVVVGLSSGTSGNKGVYLTPKELTKKLPFVFLARGGIPLRHLPFRILFCLRVFGQGFDDINSPLVHLHYCATMTPVDEIIDQLNSKRINILMAPPSLVRILLPHKDRIKVKFKQIVCYAEVLEKEEKERFKKAFATNIVEIYQASEGQIASACRHGNLHINEDLVIVELTDEQGNKIEKPGELAKHMYVTNLVNFAQPLIRYEMNDLVVLGEKCPCGSRFRTIDHILGRNDDILYFITLDNRRIPVFPDLISRWIITATDDIREYQVHQTKDGDMEVKIETLPDVHEDPKIIATKVKCRIEEELLQFRIRTEVRVIPADLPLPEDRSKYKRFVVAR
ncbi:MAG: hypothetical protein A2Y20_05850 [Firmicutes bacterium GWF2_51_9]|nr:MAG: hypothetical protein A2Y20_05850 [Firmicutes bacterium GWF2_51_9]OGS58201.1 MAG: hypothetical protein A2Y19_03620 [Firmicutes bacterium GWE2_51_13]HAM63579.1 hypothetical protein [Erysipelotrichaceae bacterium]HAO60500.1 hypothetical protein [Erysipelotrichaceae bacterium]HBZ42036.1 hypothetical protein [Erysipelotrichaceae bacterium]